jgi:hypothetical protein
MFIHWDLRQVEPIDRMNATVFRLSIDSALVPDSTAAAGIDARPPDAARELALYFSRTDAGESELRWPTLDLAAPVRELLFAIERTVAIDACLSAVRGSTLADAMLLLAWGLIRTESFEAPFASRSDKARLQPLVESILALPANELYSLLTQHARVRLGLLQGFRMVLALERCVGHHEQRALAIRFLEEIWRAHGEAGIRPLRASLRN